ncbi:MAG: hypothetical protein WBQ18_10850 [Solirubrobacteraceae bacterium]
MGRATARSSSDTAWAVAVAAACLVLDGLVNALLRHQVGLSGDEPYYSRIAAHPAGPHNFPYAFRIGVPYLVHVLPFSYASSWKWVALVAGAAAAGALYALMRSYEVGRGLAAGLAAGFSLSPPLLVVLLRNGREVDPVAILVIVLGTLFIVHRQRAALGVTLLAGAFVHESCLFLIPLAYAVWAQRPIDAAALRDLALVALVPALVYVYLRHTIVAVGESYQPGYNGPFFTERIDVLRDALRNGGWHGELRRMALVYGPLWLAAPFALSRLSFARRSLVLVALCVASMTFALDWGRMIFFAAPAFYVDAGFVLRHRRRLAVAAVVGLLAVDVGYAVYMQVHGVVHGLDSTAPPARGPVA